jgi:photosystem II stability/assembly factor-like uncharacterized protein
MITATIIAASPAGAGWITLPGAPMAPQSCLRHDDVCFMSPDSGWVVNGAGQIFRTIDGGTSWTLQATLPNYLRSVGFATRMKGWAGTLFGSPLLYETEDAGVTWTPVTNIPDPQPLGICGLWVVNDSVAYGCGRYDGPPATMIKTTNGGATWTSWDMDTIATSLIDCFFFDENHGFAVGGSGSPNLRHATIVSTDDGGLTWHTRYTSNRPGAEWCWKITFPTPTIGYVSIEREDHLAPRYVLKTIDGGMTWSDVPFISNYDIQGIGFVSPDFGWVGGWGGITYETTDGGASWHTAGFGLYLNRIRFLSPALAYGVGETVYKYTANVSAVRESPIGAPGLELSQNRPNPVTRSTRIAFRVRAPTHVRVTIHDVFGRTRVTLLDADRPAGDTDVTWNARGDDGRHVGAGVYWCRVETATESVERKLLVVR